jgi:hypothetical protein
MAQPQVIQQQQQQQRQQHVVMITLSLKPQRQNAITLNWFARWGSASSRG